MHYIQKTSSETDEKLLTFGGSKGYHVYYESKHWAKWVTFITLGTCGYCFKMNGRIFKITDPIFRTIPVHANCGCSKEILEAIAVGTATEDGRNGIDMYVFLFGKLPPNYITQQDAKRMGWKKILGNLDDVAPGKIIGGGEYRNHDLRLPTKEGRVWYEADFDYDGGYRNSSRLLYSNDGLIFVTYDHYRTFHEIHTGGEV